VVLQKDKRLPVFEEIDERISLIEKTRAENESAIWWEIEAFKKSNRDQLFDNENKRRQLESLEKGREMMEEEINRVKEEYRISKEEYIKLMKTEHTKMLDSIDELRKIIDKQEM
jgi:hypothetical protein